MFFSAAESEQVLFGGSAGSCAPGDKKSSKWVICWSTCRVPHHAATATECDKKTKRACQLLKF